MLDYKNFKSNVRLRCPELENKINYDMLFKLAYKLLSKEDEVFNTLTENSKNTMINNILIFNFTNDLIARYRGESLNTIEDDLLISILRTSQYRQNNLYPHKGDETFNFLDMYNPDIPKSS